MTLGAEFFTLTTLYLLALLSPGQDFFLILRHALLHGHRSAWWSCLGIAMGNGFYIALSFLGHGIFKPSPFVKTKFKLSLIPTIYAAFSNAFLAS